MPAGPFPGARTTHLIAAAPHNSKPLGGALAQFAREMLDELRGLGGAMS